MLPRIQKLESLQRFKDCCRNMQQFRAVCETLIGDGLEGAGSLADSTEVFGYSSRQGPACSLSVQSCARSLPLLHLGTKRTWWLRLSAQAPGGVVR